MRTERHEANIRFFAILRTCLKMHTFCRQLFHSALQQAATVTVSHFSPLVSVAIIAKIQYVSTARTKVMTYKGIRRIRAINTG